METTRRIVPPSLFNLFAWPMALMVALKGSMEDWRCWVFRRSVARAFSAIEQCNEQVMEVQVNRATYWVFMTRMASEYEPETRAEMLRQGVMGRLWNADVLIDNSLGNHEFKLVGGSPYREYFTQEVWI